MQFNNLYTEELSMAKRTIAAKVAEMMREQPSETILAILHELLGSAFWPQILDTKTGYRRVSDDTSGDITVVFSQDGDGWVEVTSHLDPKEPSLIHRFRTPLFGGGESEYVRNALLILAIAIKRQNELHPQHHRRKVEDSN